METSVLDKITYFPRISLRCCQRRENEGKEKKETVKISNKERMRKYRARLKKEDPKVYEEYRKANNYRNILYRANMTAETKIEQREKTRLRVQKHRANKKLEQKEDTIENKTKLPAPKTRRQTQTLRDQWRKSKTKHRANMTTQKRRRINEKRRQKYAEKQNKRRSDKVGHTQTSEQVVDKIYYEEKGFISRDAQRKAMYRAKKGIPSSPKKFASVIKSLAEKTTPRKRKALEGEGFICLTPSKRKRLDMIDDNINKLSMDMHSNRRKRSHGELHRRRLLAKMLPWRGTKEERKKFGVTWRFITKSSEVEGIWENKKRTDGIDVTTVDKVEDFFKAPGISMCLPDKKFVSTKTMEPKHVMEKSLQMTYKEFNEKNPDCHISFSKFAALRPRCVKTMQSNCFNNCLCEYCSNIELKANAINNNKGKSANILGFMNKYNLLEESLCPREKGESFHRRECIVRECSECGVEGTKQKIKDALASKTTISYNKWENQTYVVKKTGKKGSRKMLQIKTEAVDVFLEELGKELNEFSSHMHNARWQHNQFTSLIHDIPEKWIVFCMDFAENYTCLYQDEAQSAHWSHDLATLFSIVAYYRCQECEKIVNESLVFISEDMKHDSHAVHHFVSLANDHLTRTRNLKIEREIHFTDGAASQFKSKTPFADVAESQTDFGFPIEKNFFGSRHGKGPCDGEFGVVKRSASQAVLARRTVIRNAKELYDFTAAELTKPKTEPNNNCCHARRTVFYVNENNIDHARLDRINVKPVNETRKLHAIKACNTGFAKRLLSCFCKFCVDGQWGQCENAHHLDDWQPTSKMKRDAKKKSKVMLDATALKNKAKETEMTNGKLSETKKSSQAEAKQKFSDDGSDDIDLVLPTRSQFFTSALAKLQSAKTFAELTVVSTELQKDARFENYTIGIDNSVNMMTHKLVADKVALNLLPKGKLQKEYSNRLPVRVQGDGNCLARAASVVCFGNEEAHEEIRARIVVELCKNKEEYISNEFLNKGMTFPKAESANLSKSYTMFSEKYTAGDVITPAVTEQVFEEETLSVAQADAFMGIWQMFALATVVGAEIVSMYPDMGDRVPILLLNRIIYPQYFKTYRSALIIMWSSAREDMVDRNWVPNHFVPLLPQLPEEQSILEEFDVDEIPDIDLMDISMMDISLETLGLSPESIFHEEPVILEGEHSSTLSEETSASHKLITTKWHIGTHLSVNIGKKVLAALVVPCPDEVEPNENGLWVQFFEDKKTFSVLADKSFFVLFEDILGRLQDPTLQLIGSRIVYKFL